MRRRELLFSDNTDAENGSGTTMDVLFSKNDGSSLKIFHPGEWPSKYQYTPIGVVLVPASHNRYGDNTCGVMSLKSMDYSTPTSGRNSPFEKQMYWGYSGTSIGNYIFVGKTVLTGTNDNYIPHQANSGSTATTMNSGGIVWPYQGTSTAPTSAASTVYTNTRGYVTATSGKSGCDFNGIRNTAAIYIKTKASSQWTDSTIPNENVVPYTPAAACCARYKTIGTKSFLEVYSGITSNNTNYGTSASTKTNTGFWYMPAEGELSYFLRYAFEIVKTLDKLNLKWGDYVVTPLSAVSSYGGNTYFNHFSSTEVDASKIWTVYEKSGLLSSVSKASVRHARAFMRFKLTT